MYMNEEEYYHVREEFKEEVVNPMLAKIQELRDLVWGEDIPSPCCPEYREHHESIQKILKFIDTEF